MPAELPWLAAGFALFAALIHVYIFVLESLQWTKESTRRTFGVRSAADSELLRPMAYNQGFYNLFLALGTLLGVWFARVASSATFGVGIGMLLLALVRTRAKGIRVIDGRTWFRPGHADAG